VVVIFDSLKQCLTNSMLLFIVNSSRRITSTHACDSKP